MIELHKIYGHISSVANRKLFLEEQRKHHPLLRNASPHFHQLLTRLMYGLLPPRSSGNLKRRHQGLQMCRNLLC
jgi:hypothetical protein